MFNELLLNMQCSNGCGSLAVCCLFFFFFVCVGVGMVFVSVFGCVCVVGGWGVGGGVGRGETFLLLGLFPGAQLARGAFLRPARLGCGP